MKITHLKFETKGKKEKENFEFRLYIGISVKKNVFVMYNFSLFWSDVE